MMTDMVKALLLKLHAESTLFLRKKSFKQIITSLSCYPAALTKCSCLLLVEAAKKECRIEEWSDSQ